MTFEQSVLTMFIFGISVIIFFAFMALKCAAKHSALVSQQAVCGTNLCVDSEEYPQSVSRRNGECPGDKWYIHGMAPCEEGVREHDSPG